MIANYHTHTYRCGHAEGHEKEYIEVAVKSGMKILGISDHTPYDFYDSAPRNRPMRMKPEELPAYAESIHALAEAYRDRIEIISGVEAEYYPKYFDRLVNMLKENGIQYMILGQHFLGNEIDEPYVGRSTSSDTVLERYVNQSIEAMNTGLFTYFAHPDLIWYTGRNRTYQKQMRRLCEAALTQKLPLEINMQGIRGKRNYPDDRFWKIVGETGNEVVIGCDAHRPQDVNDPVSEEKAMAIVERYHLNLCASVPIREL